MLFCQVRKMGVYDMSFDPKNEKPLSAKDYHQKKSDILWEYISDKDIPEIQKRLEELEK